MNSSSLGPTGGPVVNPAQARRNRIVLGFLLLSFVAPFLIGHFAYYNGWFRGAPTTNKGVLLNPPALFADLHLQDQAGKPLPANFLDHHWWLVYVLPAECGPACHNSLYQMRQVRIATGKYAERVRQLVIQPQAPDVQTLALLGQRFPDFIRVAAPPAALDAALMGATPAASGAGRLYIMDPQGMLMLSYAGVADEKTSVVKAQDVLDDLKKLLKDSDVD